MPCTVPSSPLGPLRDREPHVVALGRAGLMQHQLAAAGRAAALQRRAESGAGRQRPSREITTLVTSKRSFGRADSTLRALLMDTSCSPD